MRFAQLKVQTLLLSLLVMATFTVSSCLDQSTKQDQMAEQNQIGDQKITVTLGALPQRTGRYLGTYDEVTNVKLHYRRSDGIGDNKMAIMEKITSTYGGSSPVTQWTGALDGVVAGARYDFEAKAYKDRTEYCEAFPSDYYPNCHSLLALEPPDEFVALIFSGMTKGFKIEAGANNLQMRMEPVFKTGADQQIPYITSMFRNKLTETQEDGTEVYERTESFANGDKLRFGVNFRGTGGTFFEVEGKVSGTCAPGTDQSVCKSINNTFFPAVGAGTTDNRFRICSDLPYQWSYGEACTYDDNETAQIFSNFYYDVPQNAPDQLRIEFKVSLASFTTETGYQLVGTTSSTWFVMNKSSIEQGSELVFMPTIQNMSLTYDTSSDSADLSYAMVTHGLSSDIEIFANLEYKSVVPLGFPSPFIGIDYNGEGSSTQTLYGRIDKNDLYDAQLNINFVHKPTGFISTTDFPLLAYDKPKFGSNSAPTFMWYNYFLANGVCRHCNMSYMLDTYGASTYFQDLQNLGPEHVATFPITEADYENPWDYYSVKMNGGDLGYSALERVKIQYIKLENTNFLGTNLKDSTFYYTDLSGSQFLNSQIYNTKFEYSLLNNASFSSNDGLSTTQNLPYTDIHFKNITGSNLNFNDLTTKMVVTSSNFANANMSNNLIYQSNMNGMQLSGSFENNDVLETTIESSNFDNTIMTGTSFVSTSIGLSSMKGSDLSRTWFDRASGTSLYLVACDAATVLPVYNNVVCQNGNLQYLEDATQEFVLDLPNGKTRASYLYSSDSDSFRILVTSPKSIAVELTSKDSMLNFNLRKSGENTIQQPDAYGTRTTVRDDGTYTTVWKYYTGLNPVTDTQYYYAQISGFEGVYYVTSYFTEDL